MSARGIVLGIVAVLATGPANAGELCRILADPPETVTLLGLGNAKCSLSLGLGGVRARACRWPYAYRAPEAREAFARLVADVADCPGATAMPLEEGVNHPDSYDLRRFSLEGDTVAVSLKDKAALRETYIFLRVEMRGD